MNNSVKKMFQKQISLKSSLQKTHKNNPFQQLIGLCKEPAPPDLAENHDRYLMIWPRN